MQEAYRLRAPQRMYRWNKSFLFSVHVYSVIRCPDSVRLVNPLISFGSKLKIHLFQLA